MNSNFARLNAAFNLQKADRPPILGGWLAAPNHIIALSGCAEEEYWADPRRYEIAAEHVLGSDGMVDVFKPVSRGEYRIVDHATVDKRAAYTVDSMLEEVRLQPDVDEIRAAFDEERDYAAFAAELRRNQAACGEITWVPAFWDILPIALWYSTYGYETALTALAGNLKEYRKLLRTSAEKARLKNILLARAIRAGLHLGTILTGEDICSQAGPMVSPRWLRKEYWPLFEYVWEPLLQAGAKLIWHCDGDVRPLLPDILASGVSGLQGFQRACGLELEWIVDLRTRKGDPLIIYGPMEVAVKFRNGTPEDVREEVRRSMEICRDKASLVFFTSNTITPDIPLENVRAYWQAVRDSRW